MGSASHVHVNVYGIETSDLLSEFNTRPGHPVARRAPKMMHCRRVLELQTKLPIIMLEEDQWHI